MRLVVVSPFVDRRHGTERALAELLENLAFRHHCQIRLYSQRVEGLKLRLPGGADSSHSGSLVWRRVPKVGGPHLIQFLAWLFLNTLCRRWDERILGQGSDALLSPGINCLDADLVIVHALFRRLKQLAAENRSGRPGSGVLRRWHQTFYYSLLSRFEQRVYSDPGVALAAVSARGKQLLTALFHKQEIALIPNAVDPAEFSTELRLGRRASARAGRGLGEKEQVLLLIGNDWRVKGLSCVLEAIRKSGLLSLRLLVVGSEEPARFRDEANRLGIAERVRFEPPNQEALDLYAAADIYVSPSLEDSFGLPVLEAMACGLPVVTSPLAGVSELVSNRQDGIVLEDPRDAEELAGILKRLALDGALRQELGAAAALRAKRCGWEESAAVAYKLLNELVEAKSRLKR